MGGYRKRKVVVVAVRVTAEDDNDDDAVAVSGSEKSIDTVSPEVAERAGLVDRSPRASFRRRGVDVVSLDMTTYGSKNLRSSRFRAPNVTTCRALRVTFSNNAWTGSSWSVSRVRTRCARAMLTGLVPSMI